MIDKSIPKMSEIEIDTFPDKLDVTKFMEQVGELNGKPVYVRNITVIGGGCLVMVAGGGLSFIKDVFWNEQNKDFVRSV